MHKKSTKSYKDVLVECFKGHEKAREGWAKEIWDMAAVAYLLNDAWVPTALRATPGLNDDLTWRHAQHDHLARVAYFVDRNAIFSDFFEKLARYKSLG